MRKIVTLLFTFPFLLSPFHSFAQSSCNCWQERDTSYHPVPFLHDYSATTPPQYRNDDGYTNVVVLPFHFCFWGKSTDSIYINNNGNVSFGAPYSTFTPDTFPTSSFAMIAPFWGDVDTRPAAMTQNWDMVYYSITASHLVIQWDSVGVYKGNGYTDTDQLNSFQLIMTNGNDPIIPKGNNVEFCYHEMGWTTGEASGGNAAGFGGSPATVGANEGDGVRFIQIGLFDSPGTSYFGQFPPGPNYDQVQWLESKSFIFNLCAGTIAPLTSGVTPCDTFRICEGDSLLIPFFFFSPIQGDSVWSNLSPPIPTGVSVYSNRPGPTDSITIKIVGSSLNLGYSTVNVYGYDNATPEDTTYTSFVIEVDTAPRITVHAFHDTICVGDTSFLTAGGGRFYTWSTGATTSNVNVTPTITQTYTVGISDGGCVKDTMIQVVVLPTPSPRITAKPDSICPHDSVLLIASGGGRYTWSTGKTNDSIWVKPTTTTSYTLSSSNGICSDSTKISVFVKTIGSSTLSLAKDSLCPYDSTTLTASGGTSYRWNTGATTSSITVFPGSTKTYTVYATVQCTIDTLVKQVVVIPLPVPKITGRLDVCSGQGDTLTVSGGTTYLWNNGSTKTTYILKDITGDSTLTVQLFNGKCYVDTTVKVDVQTYPTFSVTPGIVCSGSCITIKATYDTGYTYRWNTGANTDTTTVCPDSTTSYTVTVSHHGCSNKKSTSVQVYLSSLYACCDTTITKGDTAILLAGSDSTCKWSPSNSLNCDTCKRVIATPTVTTTYTITGIDADGCTDTRQVTVIVDIPCSDFTVPNVFTPNGDGINDMFEIKTKELDSYSIIIYDRWDKQMYKSSDPTQYWNGNTEGGSKAADGVYYYIITSTCNGNNYDKQGFVQLIR